MPDSEAMQAQGRDFEVTFLGEVPSDDPSFDGTQARYSVASDEGVFVVTVQLRRTAAQSKLSWNQDFFPGRKRSDPGSALLAEMVDPYTGAFHAIHALLEETDIREDVTLRIDQTGSITALDPQGELIRRLVTSYPTLV